VQEETRNVARAVARVSQALRKGQLKSELADLPKPRPKWRQDRKPRLGYTLEARSYPGEAHLTTFLQKILAATRLTQRGRLDEATRAIQRALAPAEPVVAPVSAGDRLTLDTMPEPMGLDSLVRGPESSDDPVRLLAGRFVASSFTGASGTRGFKLFEPSGFDGVALPLVVMLHGCTQDADDFAAGTRMNLLAQERGLFVLYPEQAPRSNSHKCWNWFVPGDQRRGRGEPALLAGMVRHVMATHAVDADRVYVAGLSAGGAMAAILAREYPDLFAAAGVHSGLAPGSAHDVASAFTAMQSGSASGSIKWPALAAEPARTPLAAWPSIAPLPASPVPAAARGAPLIVFHGDADATVHSLNGTQVIEAALGEAAWQATQDPEVDAAPVSDGGRAFTRTVYRAADAAADSPSRAEHWLVHGAAHAWSGGDASGSFTESAGPDASREMLRFFAEHPRRRSDAASFRS
jgi:poly(hydroxyalkanoate) depolymerase family esterase